MSKFGFQFVYSRIWDPVRNVYGAGDFIVGTVVSSFLALLIVMTGTVDLLRAQTQRRIDMELVGVRNPTRQIALISRRSRPLGPVAQAFVEIVQEIFVKSRPQLSAVGV